MLTAPVAPRVVTEADCSVEAPPTLRAAASEASPVTPSVLLAARAPSMLTAPVAPTVVNEAD